MYLNPVNDANTLCLWIPYFQDQPISFFIWDVATKDTPLREVKCKDNYKNTQLIFCYPWGKDHVGFFMNIGESGTPEISIVNIVNGDEQKIKLDYLKDTDWMLADIFYGDFSKQIFIIHELQEASYIQIYNPVTKNMTFRQEMEDNYKWVPSIDGKYCIQYIELYSGDEKENEPSTLSFKLTSIVRYKVVILYYLKKTGIVEKYNPHIVRMIVEQLAK